MAQFNAAKNPPWVRDATTGLANLSVPAPAVTMVGGIGQPGALLSQPGVATPTVYSLAATQMATGQPQYSAQQIGVANLQAAVQLSQPGIAIPTTLATSQIQTVSYPAPRLHPVQGNQQQPPQQQQQQQQQQPKQRVFTGTVTKLHDNFGFVDEDVFFQTNCVKGAIPKVGDRVLVEASYNANMPFKWNATRIQVLPSQQKMSVPPSQNPPSFNSVKPMVGITPAQLSQPPPPLMSQNPQPPPSIRTQGPSTSGIGSRRVDPPSYERNRDRDRDRRSPVRRRSPPRKRSRSPRRHSRSPARRSSPTRNRRQARPTARYMVQVPKISLDMKEANVMTLKGRYSNMYVPSDFFNSSFSWTEAFPLHRSFELGKQCSYYVMHKEVDPIVRSDAVFEPPDADHLYSAKVMLAASPTVEDLYKKCCPSAEDPSDSRDMQHPTRLISFLVGLKGKEPMAIGGPWSPSLDGANPSDDPRVLINTAIRTTRALTGIDLAGVTQWYRFAEIRYHRPEEVHKGRVVPARVETVVLFLPDVWSCNPSRLEWDGLALAYKKQLQDKFKEESQDDTQEEEGDEEGESIGEPKDPTHYAELDPKTLKVNDLRKELEARSLSSKGLKSQLIARLTKTLKSEQEVEEQEAENKEEEPEVPKKSTPPPEVDEKDEEKKKKEDEEKKRRDERERAVRERRYTLPSDTPAILVHPSTTAKSGKFDCTVMSLSVLLDYRPDDNKEHTFEVSLFAELFNEMIMRDFSFNIYKALVAAPEKPKEDTKKDKRKEKDKSKEKHKEEKTKEDKSKEEKTKEEKAEKPKEEKAEEKTEEKEEKSSKEKKDTGEDDKGEPPVKRRRDDERRRESAWDKGADKKKDDDKPEGDKAEADKGNEKEEEEDDRRSTVSHKSDRDSNKEKKKEKVKMYTANWPVLLAFSYFDLSHVGYLQDKDMEDILHTLGLQLSRAQVKKLVGKITSKDQVQYRKLTDKEENKEEKKEDVGAEEGKKVSPKKEGQGEEAEEAMDVEIDDELLAKGNRPLLPQVKDSPNKRNKAKKDSDTVNMVMHKGAMLDIPSMVQRLEKSEKLKRDTDTKLKDLQEEMDMLKDSCKSSEQTSQKVALELQELKKKLRDQRKATDRSETDAKKYYEVLSAAKTSLSHTLTSIQDVITPETKISTVQIKKEINGD